MLTKERKERMVKDVIEFIIMMKHLTIKTILRKCRARYSLNPLGSGNSKTGCIGTYRPVGPSCPPSCSYLNNGCYTQSGRVFLQQKRATMDETRELRTNTVALTLSAITGLKCRLMVAGGWARNGEIDTNLINNIVLIIETMREYNLSPVEPYSYTHFAHDEFKPYADMLSGVGVSINFSDYFGPRGAVVWSHDDIQELRSMLSSRADIKGIYMCPAQRSKAITCQDCKSLCTSKAFNGLVVFDPHGSKKTKAKEVSTNLLELLDL